MTNTTMNKITIIVCPKLVSSTKNKEHALSQYTTNTATVIDRESTPHGMGQLTHFFLLGLNNVAFNTTVSKHKLNYTVNFVSMDKLN